MSGSAKPVGPAVVQVTTDADVVIVSVSGLIDERFKGFGSVGTPASIVLDVSGLTRMTSFGVRQWLKAMDALPKAPTEQYLLGCPTFFVDQLNMVLNFGGAAKVLTAAAPHTCTSCGTESSELIDVFAERTNLANGATPERLCRNCGGKLEFDESPESYFAFVGKYQPTNIDPRTAAVLSARNLYTTLESAIEKPPRIIKLVQDSVTYFRMIGRIGSMFRARPFLVGAEGEVVIDLNEVEVFEAAGAQEWRRMIKNLSGQVSAVTLLDVRDAILLQIASTLTISNNINVASVLVNRTCSVCEHVTVTPETLEAGKFAEVECTLCGGILRALNADAIFAACAKVGTSAPAASASVIANREALIAKALKEASAQPTDTGSATATNDDAILGKYKIVRRLPSTSGVDVFLAKQVGIGGFEKPVVLKKLDKKLLEARQRSLEELLDELKLVGRLTHPNIVQVLDVGEVGGTLYIALEYVNGRSLFDIVERMNGPMPIAEALHIARDMTQALEHAYVSTDMAGQQAGVLHGDLRPQNVLISMDGTVKMVDFGDVMATITANADPLYLTPESGTDQYDHRSDIFSLGVLMYRTISGQHPFPRPTGKSPKKKVEARPIEELVSVPIEIANLLASMLSLDPDQRPQRANEVLAEINHVIRSPGLESSPSQIGAMIERLFPADGPVDPPRTAERSAVLPSRPSTVLPPKPATAPFADNFGNAPVKLDDSVAIVPEPRLQLAEPTPNLSPFSTRKIALVLAVMAAGALLIYLGLR